VWWVGIGQAGGKLIGVMAGSLEALAAQAISAPRICMENRMMLIQASPMPITWNPGQSIYASETFLKTVGDDYGWLGGTDSAGNLRCVLPYTVVRKGVLRMVRFRLETVPMGQGLDIVEEKQFLGKVVEYFRSKGAHAIIPQSTNAIFRTYPEGAIAAPYGSYVIDLRSDEQTLFGRMSATHRKKIRGAAKAGVKIRSGIEHLEVAYDIITATLKRSSMGFMRYRKFRELAVALGDNVKLFVAEHEGAIQGCTLFPFSEYSAYSLYGGSISSAATGAMNLLNWEAIRLFRELGVRRYDFVGVRLNPKPGSKQEGIATFKQRFGGELKQGYIWKYPLHPVMHWVYSIGARLLRGGDIVDQERKKLRHPTSVSQELDK
jgi:hypothetical protein